MVGALELIEFEGAYYASHEARHDPSLVPAKQRQSTEDRSSTGKAYIDDIVCKNCLRKGSNGASTETYIADLLG